MASKLINKKGLTLKFTLEELRDNISQYKCGVRGQTLRFHQLEQDLSWTGKRTQLKVPVIHMRIFPDHIQDDLIKSKYIFMFLVCIYVQLDFMLYTCPCVVTLICTYEYKHTK